MSQRFFSMEQQPLVGQDLLIARFHDNIQAHHTWYNSSGRGNSPKQGPLLENTQHPQQADIHAPCGTRTRKLCKLTVADSQLRLRGNWN